MDKFWGIFVPGFGAALNLIGVIEATTRTESPVLAALNSAFFVMFMIYGISQCRK